MKDYQSLGQQLCCIKNIQSNEKNPITFVAVFYIFSAILAEFPPTVKPRATIEIRV